MQILVSCVRSEFWFGWAKDSRFCRHPTGAWFTEERCFTFSSLDLRVIYRIPTWRLLCPPPPLLFLFLFLFFSIAVALRMVGLEGCFNERSMAPTFFAAYLDFHFFSTHIKCPFSGLVSFFLSLSGRKFSIRRFYAISKSQIKRVFKAHTPIRSSGHQFRAGGQVGKAKSQASLKEKCDRSDHCRRVKEETAVSRAKECDRCDRPPHLPTLMASF